MQRRSENSGIVCCFALTYIRLGLSYVAANLVEACEELSRVNLLVTVEGVQATEDASKSADRLGSPRGELSAELFKN